MDISMINGLPSPLTDYTSLDTKKSIHDLSTLDTNNASFETLFQSALDLVNETNSLSNAAEEEEINFSLGYSDNMHDLQVAQQKANISLQYTVAIRNKVLEAYKEIMNLQF